jgi:hypothetical protein
LGHISCLPGRSRQFRDDDRDGRWIKTIAGVADKTLVPHHLALVRKDQIAFTGFRGRAGEGGEHHEQTPRLLIAALPATKNRISNHFWARETIQSLVKGTGEPMTVQTVKLAGKSFVILPEKDFRQLQKKAEGISLQDKGDIAEAKRREREPSVPLEMVRKRLGL